MKLKIDRDDMVKYMKKVNEGEKEEELLKLMPKIAPIIECAVITMDELETEHEKLSLIMSLYSTLMFNQYRDIDKMLARHKDNHKIFKNWCAHIDKNVNQG